MNNPIDLIAPAITKAVELAYKEGLTHDITQSWSKELIHQYWLDSEACKAVKELLK